MERHETGVSKRRRRPQECRALSRLALWGIPLSNERAVYRRIVARTHQMVDIQQVDDDDDDDSPVLLVHQARSLTERMFIRDWFPIDHPPRSLASAQLPYVVTPRN